MFSFFFPHRAPLRTSSFVDLSFVMSTFQRHRSIPSCWRMLHEEASILQTAELILSRRRANHIRRSCCSASQGEIMHLGIGGVVLPAKRKRWLAFAYDKIMYSGSERRTMVIFYTLYGAGSLGLLQVQSSHLAFLMVWATDH